MKRLRSLLRLNHIYSQKPLNGLIGRYAVLLVAIQIVSLAIPFDRTIVRFIGFAIWSLYVWRAFIKYQLIRNRLNTIDRVSDEAVTPSLFAATAIGESTKNLNGTQEHSFSTIASGRDWKLYESVVEVYKKSKNGRILSDRLYYTIFEGKLTRPLPNIVFDSKRAKGSQFKYAYLESQRLSLEGNFDASYTVYAPNNYKIDTLSFITPEVMLAFQEAHDYDVELKDDRLFMFGPLLLESDDDDTMAARGQKLLHELNDNIDNYQDSWLTDEADKKTTQYARKLLKSPFKPAVGLALSLAAGGFLLFGRVRYGAEWLDSSSPVIIVIFFIVLNGLALYSVITENKQANADFIKEVRTQA